MAYDLTNKTAKEIVDEIYNNNKDLLSIEPNSVVGWSNWEFVKNSTKLTKPFYYIKMKVYTDSNYKHDDTSNSGSSKVILSQGKVALGNVNIYLDDDAVRPYLLYRPDTSSKQVDFIIASKYASWQDVISNSTTRKDVTTNNIYFFPYFNMENHGYSDIPPFYTITSMSSNWNAGGALNELYTDSKNRKIYIISSNAGLFRSPFDTVKIKYDNYTKANYLPAKYDTNIPMFTEGDIDSIVKWIYDGDRSGELKLPSPPAIFGLWIDGLKKPIYKLNWHIEELEDNNYDFDDVVVEIKAGVSDSTGIFHKTLLTVPYNDGSVNFSWYDFENLGLKTSILNPNVELIARVVFPDGSKTEYPSVKLKEKSLNFDGMYSDITSASDGSTFEVRSGSGEDSDDYVPPENSDDGNDDSGDGYFSTSNALTKTYGMTLSRLRTLGQFLWSSSFIDNIKLVNNSPIENIISVKAFPFNISGSDEIIQLGNVDTGVNGALTNSNVVTLSKGSVNIDKKYDSFLDYAPYTKVTLHLPYIGFVELDTNIVMGNSISIRYIVDLIEGSCLAQVVLNSRVINEYKGNIGIDIPITSNNRAQVEASHVAGAINAIGNTAVAGISAATGNFVGTAYGVQNAVNSLLDSAMTTYHYSTQGGGSPAVSSGDKANRNIYVIIDRPMYQELNSFNHTKGRVCNLSKNIGHLRGFTSTTSMIDLNGIPCTAAEKEEIRQILSNGFFA